MPDDVVLPIPNLALPQHLFVLAKPEFSHLHDNARKELLAGIQADRTCSPRSHTAMRRYVLIPSIRIS